MGLKFQQKGRFRSRAEILSDDPKNRRNKRIVIYAHAIRSSLSSLLIFVSISFAIFSSSLYLGAFIDVGEVVGTSQLSRAERAKATVKQMPRIQQSTLLSPISEHLEADRFYIRRGQSVLATYSLPENAKLLLTVQQCKTIPVVEIFKCTPVSEQNKSIRNKTTGFTEFTIARPGFFHFQDSAIKSTDIKLIANIDYRVAWQRSGNK